MKSRPSGVCIPHIALAILLLHACSDFGLSPFRPQIEVSPPSLSFPCINFGEAETKGVFISNAGTGDLHIYSISFEGGVDIPFSTDGDSFILKPGTSLDVDVTYSPFWEEEVEDALIIENNTPDNEVVEIPLHGCGLLPLLEVDPVSLEFNGVRAGDSSEPSMVTLSSTGSGILSIENLTLSGQNPSSFGIEAPSPLPFSIESGGESLLTVYFTPDSASPKRADLIIESNDPTVTHREVTLYGNIDCEAAILGNILWKGSEFYPHTGEPADASGNPWYEEAFDDSGWDDVTLPEAGGIPPGYDRFYRGEIYFIEMIGTHLVIPYSDDGSYLYVNGNFIGNWGGERGHIGCVNREGYCGDNENVDPLDITPYLHYDANIIALLVSNPHEDSFFDMEFICDPPAI